MPDSNSSESSWPGFVGQLNKTFMLIRDVFGYALPGAVFLAIGLICKRYTLSQVQSLIAPYTLPSWAAFIAVVAACYVVGTLMAGVAYMPISVAKYGVWMIDRHLMIDRPITSPPASPRWMWRWLHITSPPASPPIAGARGDWLTHHATEVTADILEKRVRHPELVNTLDRRETLNVMAGSMAAALLTGWYVLCKARWPFCQILFWAGVFTAIQFLTGLSHLRRVGEAVRDSKISDPAPDPNCAQLLKDLITAATAALNKSAK